MEARRVLRFLSKRGLGRWVSRLGKADGKQLKTGCAVGKALGDLWETLGDPGSFLRLVEAKENFLHIFSVYKAGRFFLAAGGGVADLRSASEDRTY